MLSCQNLHIFSRISKNCALFGKRILKRNKLIVSVFLTMNLEVISFPNAGQFSTSQENFKTNMSPAVPGCFESKAGGQYFPHSQVEEICNYLDQRSKDNENRNKSVQKVKQFSDIALHLLQHGRIAEADQKVKDATDILLEDGLKLVGSKARVQREEYVDLESFCTSVAFKHFLHHGNLIPVTLFPQNLLTDSDYLEGAIGLCQEISKYAINRATVLDIRSVVISSALVDSIFGKLMEFDFRNGNLRKRYDSVKYQSRRLQDLIYELSLVGVCSDEILSKEVSDSKNLLLNEAEIDTIRSRMDIYDATREDVIKRCRDMQKLSKNSIYSLHRGNYKFAGEQLSQVFQIAKELEPIILSEPTLRFGSYSNAMEEYAEAKLYETWLTQRRLHTIQELEIVDTIEYLGGLMDLTGELGRYAISCATKRDIQGVKECLDTDLEILETLLQCSLPMKISKKMDTLRISTKKLENVMYELSLVKAGKGTQTVNFNTPDEIAQPPKDDVAEHEI